MSKLKIEFDGYPYAIYKGLKIVIKSFSEEGIMDACKKWEDDIADIRKNEPEDDTFAELENTTEPLAGQGYESALLSIKWTLMEDYPSIFYSIWPIKPDPVSFPENPHWPLMGEFIDINSKKEFQ